MNTKEQNRLLPNILLLVLLAGLLLLTACDGALSGDESEALQAAGVVEAVEVAVAPELSGRVVELFVDKGDQVEIGDPLFRIEDRLLEAQWQQAQATVETAEANVTAAETVAASAAAAVGPALEAVTVAEAGLATAEAGVEVALAELAAAQAGLRNAETSLQIELATTRQLEQPARSGSFNQDQPDEFDTPPWYFDKREQLEAAEAEVAAAAAALEAERANLEAVLDDPQIAGLHAAEQRLVEAQAAFLVAQALRDREIAANGIEGMDDYIQELFDAAQAELQAAQEELDQQLSDQSATELLEARGRVAAATERFELAQDNFTALLTGADSLPVRAAATGVEQAQTVVAATEAGVAVAETQVTQAQAAIGQAEALVEQAESGLAQGRAGVELANRQLAETQAALTLVDLQREKLVVVAPASGTIMSRNIQPGELARTGLSVMNIGLLDDLTVTVYLPENRYGQVSLGDQASLTADSFPDESFAAEVIGIADRAEYTPRNVQTQEDRQTTVYAIELRVDDPEGRLKPGMPADVLFDQ